MELFSLNTCMCMYVKRIYINCSYLDFYQRIFGCSYVSFSEKIGHMDFDNTNSCLIASKIY